MGVDRCRFQLTTNQKIMKKKILLIVCSLMIGFNVIAANPPAVVSKAFENKFPGAEKVKWDKENAHEYEAEFTLGGSKMSASFDETGKWLETETSITMRQVPDVVQASFNRDHPKAVVKGCSRIEKADGKFSYEIEMMVNSKIQEVHYADDGTALKK
jgi:hypothetical protein